MIDHQDENEQIAERRRKLAELREQSDPYPNDFRPNALAGEVHQRWGGESDEALSASQVRVKLAGRMMSQRVMGKASFAHIQDMTGQIQLRLERDRLQDGVYQEFKKWDLGDILGAEGVLFKTKTGELTVQVETIRLLTKALRPMPEKYHGLVDQEARYRQRYLDLLVNEDTRQTFRLRSQIIDSLRAFLSARGFVEVETPMMQPIP
ncbi:MAG: OB-fold nucleic acid binding domain-containing protein, partial [Acidiferrobacterales bacterium]